MMKNSLIIIVAVLFTSLAVQAQDAPPDGKALKLYTNFFVDNFQINYDNNNTALTRYTHDFTSLGALSLGVAWKKNEKSYREFSAGIAFRQNESLYQALPLQGGQLQTVAGSRNSTATVFTKMEGYRRLLGNDKVVFLLGSSAELYWLDYRESPTTSSTFPTSFSKIALHLAVVPRILIPFERFAIDINMPVNFVQTSFSRQYVSNPILQEEEKTVFGFDFDLFRPANLFQFRVGMAWYL